MRDLTHGLTLSKPSKPALKIGGENKQTKKDWGVGERGMVLPSFQKILGYFLPAPWRALGAFRIS